MKYSADLKRWGVTWDYRGRRRFLEKECPPQISVEPPRTEAERLYGVISFGKEHKFGVIVDSVDGRSTSIVVDANGNGDLTDDERRKGLQHVVELRFNRANESCPYAVSIRKAWTGSPDRDGPSISWGRACLMHGTLEVAGNEYPIAIEDATDDGIYGFPQRNNGDNDHSGDRILVDTNGNDRFDRMIEETDVRYPFFIDGRPFRVTHIEPNGQLLRVREEATRPVFLTVRDRWNARPLSGATMTIYPGWHIVTTDHAGIAQLRLPDGEFGVIVQRDRHIPAYQKVVVRFQSEDSRPLCEFSLVEWQRLKGTVSLRPREAHKFFLGDTTPYDKLMSYDAATHVKMVRKADVGYSIRRRRGYLEAVGQRRLIPLGEASLGVVPGPVFDGKRNCPVEEGHSYALCLCEYTRPDVFETTRSITHYIVFEVLEATNERLRIRWEFAHRPGPDAKLTWPARTSEGGSR